MQNLFHFQPEGNTGSFELRQWEYVRSGLVKNVEKIKDFYQTYPVPVSSSHLLVRLILAINISRNLSFDRYVANCNQRAMSVAQSLKLTSAMSKGQMWDGVFYGKGSNEVILAHDTLFPLYKAYDNWKSLTPITVLQHNQTNTGLMLPDGRANSTDVGVSIIAINIPMLMAMYYCFNQEQDKIELNGGARHTLYQFIGAYVLPGMLDTHLDGVVFNRLFNKVKGIPNTEAIRKHSFFLSDYDNALDTTAEQQIFYLKKINKRFGSVMKTIHLPVAGNLWEFSRLPTIPTTIQVYWALTLSKMKTLALLCYVQKDYERINGEELNTIRKLMRMHETRKVIKSNLGLEAYFQISSYLDILQIE